MEYYTHRYIARLTVEAETPISVGSGEKGIITDRLVAKDANGLPYIPGTSLAGVLRHSFDEAFADSIFGFGGNNGEGSRLIVSSACLVGSDGKTVIEGLQNLDLKQGYYSFFSRLPERDHVRMTDKGAADTENHGKYDEELVHKGTRFVFELELIGNENDNENWKALIECLASPVFRIGAGTRKGFGKLKIITENSWFRIINLKNDIKEYLEKSSSLNSAMKDWKPLSFGANSNSLSNWTKYELRLRAKDFFLFGAGFGDDDADNKPKTERYFDWASGQPKLTEQEYLLIPATSLKGIIAHRTAYYYNLLEGVKIGSAKKSKLETTLDIDGALSELEAKFNFDNIQSSDAPEWEELKNKIEGLQVEDLKSWKDFEMDLKDETEKKKGDSMPVGENNQAVRILFGYSKDSDTGQDGQRGSVVINDIYLPYKKENDKVFNHTRIDRFTGGTIDGALFQEKASQYKEVIPIEIWVENKALEEKYVKEAFEKTLEDIRKGQLQLGGNSTKGHGVFVESQN